MSVLSMSVVVGFGRHLMTPDRYPVLANTPDLQCSSVAKLEAPSCFGTSSQLQSFDICRSEEFDRSEDGERHGERRWFWLLSENT
jgi:hypothetical protein